MTKQSNWRAVLAIIASCIAVVIDSPLLMAESGVIALCGIVSAINENGGNK